MTPECCNYCDNNFKSCTYSSRCKMLQAYRDNPTQWIINKEKYDKGDLKYDV